MENDGYSLDDKRVQIEKNDIPDILEKFERRKEETNNRKKKHFSVPVREIEANGLDLSISKYREIEYDEVKYEKPSVIKSRILEAEKEIIKTLEELDV